MRIHCCETHSPRAADCKLIHTCHSRACLQRSNYGTRSPLHLAEPAERCNRHVRALRTISATQGQEEQLEVLYNDSFLDRIRWNEAGLVTVIVQDIDTGEVLMQAYADANGIKETLHTSLATFYSRSRKQRWCKGETSGNYISVKGIYLDCDNDSVIYMGDPTGPSCHTGSHTCWFTELAEPTEEGVTWSRDSGRRRSPLPAVLALEETIEERRLESKHAAKKSWTAKLLKQPDLLVSKIREEAEELCQTLENDEGKERAASEMADLLYHSMVLLNIQGVTVKDVSKVLRSRFGTSGIAEKEGRVRKQ